MMAIDTHKAYRALVEGGFSEKQADTILKVVGDHGDDLVTKNDLALQTADMKTTIAKLRSEMVIWQIGIGFALFGALKFIH